MGESFHAKSAERSELEESLPDDALTEKKVVVAPEESGREESEKMLDTHKALAEEDGVLRRLANWGEGKVKKGVATLMLGSALVFSAGAFHSSAEAAGGQNTMEIQGQYKSAGELVDGLASHAREEKGLEGYAANKRAAIDEVRAYVLSRQGEERKKALADIATELQNPAVQKLKGVQDGIRTMIDALRHMQ